MVTRTLVRLTLVLGVAALLDQAIGRVIAHQAPGGAAQAGRGGGRGGVAPLVFAAADANHDGAVTRDELRAVFDRWFTASDAAQAGTLTEAQLASGLTAALPQPPAPAAPPPEPCGGRSANPRVPCQADVDKMMAALPDKAPARPQKPRKVLVLGRAVGFVHSSIPLVIKTVEALGSKTGAWSATATYDAADVNAQNLKQYDAVFLASTTGCFLDDPNDKAATDARRAALLDFVRSGKGLAAIHAASDSYHGATCGGGGGGRAGGPGATLAPAMIRQGDRNGDQRLSRQEIAAVADAWFDRLDVDKSGRVGEQDFIARFAPIVQPAPGGGRAAGAPAAPGGLPLWPEFNKMLGGYFKFHWNDPQLITVKIDDPASPLTAMFHGKGFEIRDETYTYNQESFSRQNVHVLTSVDYARMSDEDKAKETNPRSDHDYALSWIRREGSGRVFYEAHGHGERVYAMTPMLEHVLAGIQYALGDLKADDSPSAKAGTR